MLTGWQNIDGKTFYFKKTGAKNVKGAMLLGFQNIGGKRFYFKKTGAAGVKGVLLTGRQKIGSQYYCFKETGGHGVRGELCDTWEWLLDKYQGDDSPDSCCLFSIQGAAAPKRCTTVSLDLPGKRYLRRMPMWAATALTKSVRETGKRPPVPIP